MENNNFNYSKSDLTFAKILATPTPTSWSQAYNAGNLFAILSLTKTPSEQEAEEKSLNMIGKEILNTLEQEYFTLENKNLASIKQAISIAGEKIPPDIASCLVVVSIPPSHDNILYVFTKGEGQAIIKRGDKFGAILDSSKTDKEAIVSASGYLQDNDLIVLQTKTFSRLISLTDLKSSLDNLPPSEIAENLAPKIHEKEEGGACAIIISYKEKNGQKTEKTEPDKPLPPAPVTPKFKFGNLLTLAREKINFDQVKINLTHSKKMFLTITVLLLLILTVSIFFSIKKQQDTKIQTLFKAISEPAQKKYEEGQSLAVLNKNLAREDLEQAQKILIEGKTKFKKNSKEEKQVLELLQKVENALSEASEINMVDAKSVENSVSKLLSLAIGNSNASYFTQDDKNVYYITNDGVSSIDKSTSKSKVIIKNNDKWTEVGGFGMYYNNAYVLDKKANQILKFVSLDSGFAKTNYLTSDAAIDLSQTVSLTIDGSVWILFQDGTIKKFTKGKPDNLTISGLDQPFSSPSRIFTDIDTNNLYILDQNNSRIVVLDKKGSYLAQYQTKIIKSAKDMEVLERDKKIYVLNDGKIWEINIK